MDAWYDGLPPGGISSFRKLIEVFCNQWDPSIKKEILKTMNDEQASEESEVLLDDENKHQEGIIEETKECTELIKFPCPPLTVSYDVLALLEESYENMEGDNYWEFLGPLVYDCSIPCNIMRKEVSPIISEVHTMLEPIRPPYWHSRHHLVASIEETVQPFIPYLGKSLMVHFNKVRAGRWIGMKSQCKRASNTYNL